MIPGGMLSYSITFSPDIHWKGHMAGNPAGHVTLE
jgi:hypothetical protein